MILILKFNSYIENDVGILLFFLPIFLLYKDTRVSLQTQTSPASLRLSQIHNFVSSFFQLHHNVSIFPCGHQVFINLLFKLWLNIHNQIHNFNHFKVAIKLVLIVMQILPLSISRTFSTTQMKF